MNPCGCHIWETSVNNRTGNNTDCPYCVSQKICPHNSLAGLHPQIAARWDFLRNELKPTEVAPYCNSKFAWICEHNHKYSTTWHNILYGHTCPRCRKISHSKGQIEWILQLEKLHGIEIEHAESKGGEFYLSGVGYVDGYCKSNNTIYEYHGDFWHGNPKKFPPDDIHPLIRKSYGHLYQKTLKRDAIIQSLGYTLIVKWESD